MTRYIILFFPFFVSITFSQIDDSLRINNFPSPDSLTNRADSLSINDSLLTIVKPDSIVPLYSSPLSETSFFITKNELLKTEYKYTGDYLRLYPFNFIKDLGFTGQPNETFMYGLGNSAISFLQDGITYNDRFYNSFNLNLIQSEDIDSIEAIPLPRGFLYGAYNNPVSINFITKDFVTSKPYSRIRYYQGPDRETMLDGSFNLNLTKKLIASFEATNRIVDSTYRNSDFSIWQGKFKLKYLLSNEINIIASYNYNDYKVYYNGGVDVDSIAKTGSDINEVLYDDIAAPVVYPHGKITTLTHLPKLRFLIKPAEWIKTDASLFYLYSENTQIDYVKESIENKVYGFNIRNYAQYDVFDAQLNFDYEKVDQYRYYSLIKYDSASNYIPTINSNKYDVFSVAGIISQKLLNDKFILSAFYKVSSISGNILNERSNFSTANNSTGFGLDLNLRPIDSLNLYFGYSVLSKYSSDASKKHLMELGAKYQLPWLTADLKYFVNQYNYGYSYGAVLFNYIELGDLNGLGLNLKLNFWKILLESRSSYYYSDNTLIGVPEYQTQSGIYYKDILFDNNLDLKTGFVFYHTGKNNVYTQEQGLKIVPSSNKLDFTLAGEIQKTAIIYFLWQNLLGNNYYITPYYPMPTRSIRFGVAWELFN